MSQEKTLLEPYLRLHPDPAPQQSARERTKGALRDYLSQLPATERQAAIERIQNLLGIAAVELHKGEAEESNGN